MIIKANTWKAWYQSLTTNNDANKQMAEFRKCTIYQNEASHAKQVFDILSHDDNCIIMAKAPTTGKVRFYHSVKNLGGTRINPTHEIVGMEGFGAHGTPIRFSNDSLKENIEYDTPPAAQLLAISGPETVANCTEQQGLEFKNAIFCVLPPLLYVAYLELQTRNPTELLAETVAMIKEFDTTFATNPEYPKAEQECIHVCRFLWALSTKADFKILERTSDPDDAQLRSWSEERHSTCILQAPGTPTANVIPQGAPPLVSPEAQAAINALASNLQNQTTVLEQFRQERSEARDEKKNKFEHLHDSAKLLILNASSSDGESIPSTPAESCIKFYEKSTVGKAMDYLSTTLQEKYQCQTDLSSGLVSALYSGRFLRERSDSPSNFSFFLVPKLHPLSRGFGERAMMLQLKVTQGKGWSDHDMKEAIKQGVITPSCPNELQHQTKNLWGLSSFFFGDGAELAVNLADLLLSLQQHSLVIEAKHISDPTFCTKFGYAIDTRVYRYLEMCKTAVDREQVDSSAIQFNSLVQAVLYDNFHQNLPATFAEFSPSKKRDLEKEEDTEEEFSRKKKAKEDKKKLMNKGQIEEWLCKDKDEYRRKFAGKHQDKKPKINGVYMCQRWHTKGHCFQNCSMKDSHIPSTDLNDKAKEEYLDFVKLCKGI